MTTVDPIVQQLAQARKERGWTWEELARRTGIKPLTISQIERGLRGGRFDTLKEIAGALDFEFALKKRSSGG